MAEAAAVAPSLATTVSWSAATGPGARAAGEASQQEELRYRCLRGAVPALEALAVAAQAAAAARHAQVCAAAFRHWHGCRACGPVACARMQGPARAVQLATQAWHVLSTAGICCRHCSRVISGF
jgi:hypothetical protein